MKSHWIAGHIETLVGHVPRVKTRWTWRDRLGAVAVRWGIVIGTVLWWGGSYGLVEGAGVLLLSAAACSFLGLMFTGCTPYTSPSGGTAGTKGCCA